MFQSGWLVSFCRWGFTSALSLLAVLLVLGCTAGEDDKTPLLVYSPHGRDLLSVVETAFEAAHPEIDMRYLDMGSQEVYDRLRSEAANPQADVWFGGPWSIFARGAKDGLLQASAPSWAAALPASARAPGELFYAIYQTPTLILYNSDALSEEQAPKDWPDLLAPEWQDKILIRDPLASGTMRTIFGYLVSRAIEADGTPDKGFDFLRGLDAQTKEYVHSPALLHEKLSRQEGLVSLWEMTDTLGLVARGAPVGYVFPASGTPVIPDSVGLVTNAPHEEAARTFLEWIGSQDAISLAAREAFRLPMREDLDPAAVPDWVQTVKAKLLAAPVDWQRLEAEGPDWMARWDREVRGQGGP